MSFLLANFLGGTANSNSDSSSYSDENKQLIIEKLTAKMVDSVHLEDRKAAAQTIKSLARSHRLEIGTLALDALFEELKRDLEDEELAKIVLETLDIITAKSDAGNSGDEFCEILLKNEENVGLLLELMRDSEDFYLKFTSIQILISLCRSQPFALQTAMLKCPSGVSRVMDLLKDSREIIRNEGLLLGCGLVEGSNRDLQKVLVFQGAFEEVFRILVDEEGPWTGPLIIQDAFNLVAGMLNLNTSNQTYFRDSVCFKQLAGLLALPEDSSADPHWNQTRIVNYLAALKVLDGLLCKENVDLEASQNAALRTNFIKPLLLLAFNPQIPLQVSASALNCLTGLIWCNSRAQQDFAKEKLFTSPLSSNLPVELPISSMMGAVLVALHGNAFEQRLKALEVVEAFCTGNPEGQLVLISTLKGEMGSSLSAPGTAIIESLLDLDTSRKRDPWHCWFASLLLAHLIDGNETGKQILLKHMIADEEELLTVLMLSLIRIGSNDSRGSTCQKSIIGYLQLLVIWFHDSPGSISKFLQEGSFVQYLLERITQQSSTLDTEIQGLCALIMGICVVFNDEKAQGFGSEALKAIIKNRIGPDLFVSRLSRLRSQHDKNECLNHKITSILLKMYEDLLKLVVKPTPAGSKASQTATLAQLTTDLHEAQQLLATTRLDLSETAALANKLKIGIKERDEYIARIQKIVGEKNQKIAQMAHELSRYEQQQQQQMGSNNAILQCQQDQETLQNLTETIKAFQATVARQQARIEELEAALNGSVSGNKELEKWKEAYHRLYEQVKEQLNFEGGSDKMDSVEHVVNDAVNYIEETTVTDTVNYENETVNDSVNYENEITNDTVNYTEETAVNITQKGPSLRIENEHSDRSEIITSESVEILSPSMFMSPLMDDSSVEVVSNSSPEVVSTSELVSFNQIPQVEKGDEYPELKESVDTAINAAHIVSEEFAFNDPNPAKDEIVIPSISSECPPCNFLSSDGDAQEGISVSVASKEEIDNVLSFFDNLPSVGSVQEGLSKLNVEAESENAIESEKAHESEQQVPESTELPEPVVNLVESSEPLDYFNTVQEVQQDYQDNSSVLDSSAVAASDQYSQSELVTESVEYSQATTDDYTHDYTTGYADSDYTTQDYSNQDYNQQYTESTSEYTQESEQVSYDQGPVYDQLAEGEVVYDGTGYDQSYNYDQPEQSQEYSIEQGSIDSYHQEYQQSQETQEVQEQENQGYDYAEGANIVQQEPTVDYHSQYPTYSAEETANTEYNTENPTAPATGYSTENASEYPTEYAAEYSTEQTADYSTVNTSEYPVDYGTENNTDYTAEQAAEYSTINANDFTAEYNSGYSTENTVEYTNTEYNAEQPAEYNTEYNAAEYNADYSQDQQVDYSQSQNQQVDYSQPQYSQSQDQQVDYSQPQEYTEYSQPSQEYAQEATTQETPAEEYYYYDEATGYTYGFDQNVNQYYYYDPNSGEYVYYTAAEDSQEQQQAVDDGSVASSNPSLFDTTGPPIISLQQQQQQQVPSSTLAANNFVAEQVYNI